MIYLMGTKFTTGEPQGHHSDLQGTPNPPETPLSTIKAYQMYNNKPVVRIFDKIVRRGVYDNIH